MRISRIIVVEPDRGGGFVNFAPRVMINAADLVATGLVQPASRLTYRFAVAGSDRAVKAFVQWASDELKRTEIRGVRLESFESGRPEMGQTLDRAEKFLSLIALLAALLSGCLATTPTLGGNKGTVSGAAGGVGGGKDHDDGWRVGHQDWDGWWDRLE